MIRTVTRWIKALSDPNRLRIVNMLRVRPLAVCEIREIVGLAVSTVSKHLFILREAGFVIDDKQAKWVIYRLNREGMSEAQWKLLRSALEALREDPTAIRDRDMVKRVDKYVICQR